jgi:hypothetical protein
MAASEIDAAMQIRLNQANKRVVVQQRSNPQPRGFFNDPARECMRSRPIVQ